MTETEMGKVTHYFDKIGVAVLIVVLSATAFLFIGKQLVPSPKKALAAEILEKYVANFFQPNTIYHYKVNVYLSQASAPTTYELWEDMDNDRFLNHVTYQDGKQTWEMFDLDIQWKISLEEKAVKKDIYIYSKPEERGKKHGQRVNTPEEFDELIKAGVLEAKEEKINGREVYIVRDTRKEEKAWDTLTFDKYTFQLLQTERYGSEVTEISKIETEESLPKNGQIAEELFSKLPIPIDEFTVYERHFDTSKGYVESDYIKVGK